MSKRLNITRRDFMNGVSLSLAAGTCLSPLDVFAKAATTRGYYPPALTGLRGSHVGSFEIAHAVGWSGVKYESPSQQTDKGYDLVVVGGGISGLAAAHFYRQQAGKSARILVLENHDDFGGHAKRNEFDVDGAHLIGYGGSQSIDTPSEYSGVALQLLKDVSIETDPFYKYFDRSFFARRGSKGAIYFGSDIYGRDATLDNVFGDYNSDVDPTTFDAMLAKYPISAESKKCIIELLHGEKDYLPDMDSDQKTSLMRSISYSDFLRKHAGATDEVVGLLRDSVKGYWGIGWDALSALEAHRLGQPGTQHLGLGDDEVETSEDGEPYIFHFPDGNASVARALVRKLIPEAAPGRTMEDLVTAAVDYSMLDQASSNCRVRLNSTAVDVRHTKDGKVVDVTYVRDGKTERVRGKHVVMACYNSIIPHICPELPAEQREAIEFATKIPLVYINISVRNWRAFANLGYHSFYAPQAELMHSFGMDFPVSMGDYAFASEPDRPTILHGTYVPTVPDQGYSEREQHVMGRQRLYEMSFDDYEDQILAQLGGALKDGGFDAERDVAAITVNRWPHGYAYEYNDLYDPPGYDNEHGPHILGRRQMGRISIANSDASAHAYVDGAIDAASRAVIEQLAAIE